MNKIVHETTDNGGIFTIFVEDQKAGYLSYTNVDEKTVDAEHTKVYPEFEGKGIGKQLLSALVEYARDNDLGIIPTCSFVSHAFDKGHDYDDLRRPSKI